MRPDVSNIDIIYIYHKMVLYCAIVYSQNQKSVCTITIVVPDTINVYETVVKYNKLFS